MPIAHYRVLKGTASAAQVFTPHNPNTQPHYHVHMLGTKTGASFDVAVDVQSQDKSEVLYYVNENFTPPDAAGLIALTDDMTIPGSLALDYDRVPGLVTRAQMTLLPIAELSPTSPLHSALDTLIQKAITEKATLYFFGQMFTDNNSNQYWHFRPDQGIHDIHRNQGNPNGMHSNDNGTFQDGGIFIQWADGTWAGIFLAFQTQSWTTDDQGDVA
jgi:uncharacterized protein YukJ